MSCSSACRLVLCLMFLLGGLAWSQTYDPGLLAGLQWRLIGPYRGGRVLAVTGVPGHPEEFYFGSVGGGVWKTEDAGRTWKPLFDHEKIASVGAIAVAPSDPNVIYVGTGESAIREDISFGDGVYKSVDGGKTWQHIGLTRTRHIARILVDPHNPDIVLVAALGHVYGPNPERGVFRSTDGGATWKKVLYKDENTGAIDLCFDPGNAHVVFASLWQSGRTPWSLTSGGPGSGLYKSSDGGVTWTQLKGNGLPDGVLGKIGVSVAGGNDGNRVYALIEANKGGLYRSDDAGEHWKLVSSEQRWLQRAWYFMDVTADPVDPNLVYIGSVSYFRSTDGGRHFDLLRVPHGDNHAMWIDPADHHRFIVGNDGGATISIDNGATWSSLNNQPTGQFYHVATDNRFPYSVYGSQQDLGSVAIASNSRYGRIGRRDWYSVGGGESGYIEPDPTNPDIVYAASYFGILTRYNHVTHQVQDISPWPDDPDGWPAADQKYRFTWTMPLAISPQDAHTLYSGSQKLLKTTDGGMHWSEISPDLTRNDRSKQQSSGGPLTKDNASAEYYDLIYSIAPSPVASGEIWVGTDDGLVQLTRDGGRTWKNVTPPGMPEWAKVALIDASHFDAGTAYVAVDAHKLDDRKLYLYRTHDYGMTWTLITNGLSAPGFANAVRQDTVRRGLLFAGTETAVYVSFDDGDHWQPLQLNLPASSMRDLMVKGNDLIVATHGRAFWILDDITPLRQLDSAVTESDLHLFQPAVAMRMRNGGATSEASVAKNAPDGAVIDYWLKAPVKGDITLQILDGRGKVVRSFSSKAEKVGPHPLPEEPHQFEPEAALSNKAGLNRFVWNLRYPLPPPIPLAIYDEGGPVGPMVLPGQYQVKLIADGKTLTAPLTVKLDPAVTATPADLQKQFDLLMQIWQATKQDHEIFNQLMDLRTQLQEVQKRLADSSKDADVVSSANTLQTKVMNLALDLNQYHARASEEMLNYPIELNSKLGYLANAVDSADSAPTQQQVEVFRLYQQRLSQDVARWSELQTHDLAALNRAMRSAGYPVVAVTSPEAATAIAKGE